MISTIQLRGGVPMIRTQTRLGALQIGIIVLTVATALVHLGLGLTSFDPMFILNGVGYLVLVGALYAPIPQLRAYHSRIRWGLVAFATVTILGWIAIGLRIPLAYVTKAIEVVLIGLLVMDARQK
jgi:hypothetical protein